MKPAELVAFYAAHGVDFQQVAGAESNTHGIARKRRMGTEERKRSKGRPVTETAEGSGTRVYRPRAWSHAELAVCAGGLVVGDDGEPIRGRDGEYEPRLPRMPFLAACYSWAGDRDGYTEMHRALTASALKLMTARKWPWKIAYLDGREDYYLERLTELVLDTEGCPAHFAVAAQQLVRATPHAIYMGVAEEVWLKRLNCYFIEIQGKYQAWLDEARSVIAQMLRGDDLRSDSERDTVASEPSNAA